MEGAEKIKSMMQGLRDNPPTTVEGMPVVKLRDLANSQEFSLEGGKFQPSETISLPSSNVLQFILEDGSKVSARPSGTEPKIKFYFSVRKAVSESASDAELKSAKDHCAQRISQLESTFSSMTQ